MLNPEVRSPVEVDNKNELPVDHEWIEVFNKNGNWDNYSFLNRQDREYFLEEREKFFNNEVDCPKPKYSDLNATKLAELAESKNQLLQLKKQVVATMRENGDENASLDAKLAAEQYRRRINEKLAEIGLLQAIAQGDNKRFRHLNSFIYGRPQQDIFEFVVDDLRAKIAEVLASESDKDQELMQIAQSLEQALPATRSNSREFEVPNSETFHLIKQELTNLYYKEVLLSLNKDEKSISSEKSLIDAQKLAEMMRAALVNISAEGWQVIVDSEVRNLIVDQAKKIVRIPVDRKCSYLEAQKLVVHELGTHVYRKIAGSKSRLQLLGSHLDRDEAGEEGAATTRAQVLDDEWSGFEGIDRYFGCGMAIGDIKTASGEKTRPLNFRELYNLMWLYFNFQNLNSHQEMDGRGLQEKTYDFCIRTFRSPDTSEAGLISTKDTKYLEGNIRTWSALIKNPDLCQKMTLGKYDIANPNHLKIVDHFSLKD